MPIKLSLNGAIEPGIRKILFEIGQKAINGTVVPLLVDPANQRVGIGTATPQYDLDISGDTRISGTLIFNAGIVLGMLSARNIDVPGAGSFGILSCLKAFLNNAEMMGACEVTGDLYLWSRDRKTRYKIYVDNDGALVAERS